MDLNPMNTIAIQVSFLNCVEDVLGLVWSLSILQVVKLGLQDAWHIKHLGCFNRVLKESLISIIQWSAYVLLIDKLLL